MLKQLQEITKHGDYFKAKRKDYILRIKSLITRKALKGETNLEISNIPYLRSHISDDHKMFLEIVKHFCNAGFACGYEGEKLYWVEKDQIMCEEAPFEGKYPNPESGTTLDIVWDSGMIKKIKSEKDQESS